MTDRPPSFKVFQHLLLWNAARAHRAIWPAGYIAAASAVATLAARAGDHQPVPTTMAALKRAEFLHSVGLDRGVNRGPVFFHHSSHMIVAFMFGVALCAVQLSIRPLLAAAMLTIR